jgi:hypothetical protein
MTWKNRGTLAAAIGLPLLTITAYLVWVWPRPRGNSFTAQSAPYLLSLLTGLPFAWSLTRRVGRGVLVLTFLVGGFVLLWLYALVVLCTVRGVCL